MNILIATPTGDNKLIQNSTIQDGLTVAGSLGLSEYNIGPFTSQTVIVNDVDGFGYNLQINDGGNPLRFLIFDSSSSNVVSWVSSNYPVATISNIGKTKTKIASA